MSSVGFALKSDIAPVPDYIHVGEHRHGYTCHLAAMHWGFMELGCSQQQAHDHVARVSVVFCSACDLERRKQPRSAYADALQTLRSMFTWKSNDPFGIDSSTLHGSLTGEQYSKLFCHTAQRIFRRAELFAELEVGDVLIFGSKEMPAHSMVVRERRDVDYVTVRGYNNFGTLSQGPPNAYDPMARNIARADWWPNDARGTFRRSNHHLLVIRHEDYMRTIRYLASRIGPQVLKDRRALKDPRDLKKKHTRHV